ncbi:hypothetical protein ACET3Z_010646 [Daucus carota]
MAVQKKEESAVQKKVQGAVQENVESGLQKKVGSEVNLEEDGNDEEGQEDGIEEEHDFVGDVEFGADVDCVVPEEEQFEVESDSEGVLRSSEERMALSSCDEADSSYPQFNENKIDEAKKAVEEGVKEGESTTLPNKKEGVKERQCSYFRKEYIKQGLCWSSAQRHTTPAAFICNLNNSKLPLFFCSSSSFLHFSGEQELVELQNL